MPVRVVKSTDDLKRLALVKGASASVGGVKFNSSRDKVAEFRKPEKAPEPAPAVNPPQNNQVLTDAIQAVAASNDELGKSNARVITELQKLLDKQDPKKTWRLTVNRDTRGVLQSIDVVQT